MKILFLTRFGPKGASSRLRSLQYIPWFEGEGIECVASYLFDDVMLSIKYEYGRYHIVDVVFAYWRRIIALIKVRQFDFVFIEKEALPWFPAWFETWLLNHVRYALDFDDAIFHNYDLHRYAWVRNLYGRRIDSIMAGAHLVTAGNRYLADRAIAAGTRWVDIIPTVVDLARYVVKRTELIPNKPIILWIGSPSTVQYLSALAEPLKKLADRHSFTLRVIGGGLISIPGVSVESLDWSLDTEADSIAECDIGIMPLQDTPWEQGKCAYKLIQYMACGLPAVASPIGANLDVLIDGNTGFFASTSSDWVEKLDLLLCDAELRQRLGRTGRERVEARYCLQKAAPILMSLLTEAIRP
jgi:glycosyltransferase involved in cell wall biosynthesis